MGVLLRVPELRDNLNAVTGGHSSDGDKLALIVKDWVNGASVPDIANRYFTQDGDNEIQSITRCGQNLFGRLTQTASWGLGALLSITGDRLSEEQQATARNLPSRVYYGVNSDEAIMLRLLGVPRTAAEKLANRMGNLTGQPIANARMRLRDMDEAAWGEALGQREGAIYREVWRLIEGLE
jgi:hypothetical protein